MKPALAQVWDQVAEDLNGIALASERVRYAAAIKPLLTLPKGARILEAGCGSGRLLRTLDALGYQRLVGLEISYARLSSGVQRFGPSTTLPVCSNAVPFKSESFDAVVSAAVVEHVVNPDKWLVELARVTKPKGLVSIVTDTYMWYWLQQLGLYRSSQPLDKAIWPWILINWAEQAGLELIGCGGFVNRPEQRSYFVKRLPRLIPVPRPLKPWLRRAFTPVVSLDEAASYPGSSEETTEILEAVRDFPYFAGHNLWACIWSYECYYWFRKC